MTDNKTWASEGNAAPSGRRYRIWDSRDGVEVFSGDGLQLHDAGALVPVIPLADVRFVAALLAERAVDEWMRFAAFAARTAVAQPETMGMPTRINEDWLAAEIASVWGPAGAHADLFASLRAALAQDKALLDHLDTRRREDITDQDNAPDNDQRVIGHVWSIYGQYDTVREALSAAVAQPETEP